MDMLDDVLFKKRILQDENFDQTLSLCAEEDNRILGFGYGMKRKVPYYSRGLEPERGWICILFVAPDQRRKGIGTMLCQELENRLCNAGASEIVLGAYSPNYFVPGVDTAAEDAVRFFGGRGYRIGEKCFSMRRIIQGYQIPPAIVEKRRRMEAEGYQFTSFQPKYETGLRALLSDNFSPGWYRNVEILLSEKKAERQIYICLSPSDKVIGFCMRGMDDSPNRFGPFGVDAAYRNHSLGSVLFCSALYHFTCQGIYFIYFLSTDANGKRFYERQGLECFRQFHHMYKDL